MINKQPLISVVMPVYNTAEYLKEAIESVINQTFKDWELICVNDGSTDDSLEILREFETLDKRIILLNQKHLGTASAARNSALNIVRGEFIQILDSDDFLSNNCLENNLKSYKSSNADIVLPDLFFFENSINNIIHSIIGYDGNRDIILTPIEAFSASLLWKISGVGLISTKLIKKFGFDETTFNGDEYTTRLLFLNSNKIAFSNGIYYYRQHTNSTTQKISLNFLDRIFTSFKILEIAEEYKLNIEIISCCKKIITDKLIRSVQYLQEHKHKFIKSDRLAAELKLKEYLKKTDKTFIKYNGNTLNFIFKRILFVNFNFIVLYVFIVNLKKYFNR